MAEPGPDEEAFFARMRKRWPGQSALDARRRIVARRQPQTMRMTPTLILIAGPNGAGKSTLYENACAHTGFCRPDSSMRNVNSA